MIRRHRYLVIFHRLSLEWDHWVIQYIQFSTTAWTASPLQEIPMFKIVTVTSA